MSKRGHRIRNKHWDDGDRNRRHVKYFGEHDDRDLGPSLRQVHFKSNKTANRKQRFEEALRAHIEDGDIDMSTASSSRGHFKSGGDRNRSRGFNRGSRQGSPGMRNTKLFLVPSECYKIFLPHGGKYPKDYILKTLMNYIKPQPLIPIAYKITGSESHFFVDEFKSAQELAHADRKITMTDGFKLVVKVRPSGPQVDIDPALKEHIKHVMGKRYNAATRALDLNRFHLDPELVDHTFVPLCRNSVLKVVVDIIIENIPELVGINLSENKLHTVDCLRSLASKTNNVNTLHIGRNKLKSLISLECIKSFDLRDLMLDGNPLCSRYKQETEYVSEVRKIFPKLLKLDGVDLPPPITFDVAENTKLPPAISHFTCSQDGQNIVRQFLEQYYSLYDTNQRKGLIDAYTDNALLSLTCAYIPGQSGNSRHDDYILSSRNLLKVYDSNRRQKCLHVGKRDIVSFLDTLPKTQHDPMSFCVDLTVFMPQIILFNVIGLFREIESNDECVRSFCRTFVLIPVGSGFCIINEELFITRPTHEQLKIGFKNVPVIASPPVVVSPSPALQVPVVAQQQPSILDDDLKLQMIQAVSTQTSMNIVWSRKCLEDSNWNFEQAIAAFTHLHKLGSVPADAFIK